MELLTNLFGMQVKYAKWSKIDSLPLYIATSYEILSASFNDVKCIVLIPLTKLATLPALKTQIKRIQEIDNLPVVLKLSTVSFYRKQNLLENRLPFITDQQVYLPFMGTFLNKKDEELKEVKKFMFSTQLLVLLYLYDNKPQLYISEATKQLPFTAMTISRAVKQLETVNLFIVKKDGVNKVIESKYEKSILFDKLRKYLSTPVRKFGYLDKKEVTNDMVLAGENVLAQETMLNSDSVKTYAVEAKSFHRKLADELIDPSQQVRIELWEYNPRQFAVHDTADILSVILSLTNDDERITQAIEQVTYRMWGA